MRDSYLFNRLGKVVLFFFAGGGGSVVEGMTERQNVQRRKECEGGRLIMPDYHSNTSSCLLLSKDHDLNFRRKL